jgi:hypothetical protein
MKDLFNLGLAEIYCSDLDKSLNHNGTVIRPIKDVNNNSKNQDDNLTPAA